jgi:hypothetical protein
MEEGKRESSSEAKGKRRKGKEKGRGRQMVVPVVGFELQLQWS